MSKGKASSILLLMLSAWATPGLAVSFKDPVDGRFDLGEHLAENAYGFMPIPIIITEPAVGYGGGVVGLFLHETEEEKSARKQLALSSYDGGAQLMPSAITVVGAAGTQNGTWFAFAGHQHSWFKDAIRYTVGGGVGKANLDIYGATPAFELFGKPIPSQPYKFGTESKGAGILQQLKFRVARTPLMLGIKQIAAITSVELEFDLSRFDIPNLTIPLDDIVTSGLGLIGEYDTRDNIFYPTKGYMVGVEYMIYDEKLGSTYSYQHLTIDGEVYIPIAERWTLAFAGDYQYYNSSEVVLSPTVKPYVGLRGVASYRYQGDDIITLQSQVTYDIDNRWSVSAFYGAGMARVENDLTNEITDNNIDAYGAGFRYQIARRYGLRLGMDLAFSSDGENAIYFNVGSGF